MRSANLRAILAGMLLAAAPLPALAFENFDKGKSPQQVFASDCAICHHTPAGLGNSLGASGLASFLSDHYTASKDVANALAGYLATQGREPAPQLRTSGTRRAHASAPDVSAKDGDDKPAKPRRAKSKSKSNAHKPPAEQEPAAKPNAGTAAPDATGSISKPETPKVGD